MMAASSPGKDATAIAPDLELALERSVRAPSLARAAIAQRMAERGVEEAIAQTVVLLVSEVVSNAVRHSDGPRHAPIVLSAYVGAQSVRVAVGDGGGGFVPRPRDPECLSDGYGLYLVDKAASSWGVEDLDGTTVWFEIPR